MSAAGVAASQSAMRWRCPRQRLDHGKDVLL